MTSKINFKFMPYYDEMTPEDYHHFDIWGKLDILIDGVSFFSNYNYPENEDPIGVTKEGFVCQLATFLGELPDVPQKLYEEEKVVVEDDSTSRTLVFSLRENLVSFALCRFEPTFPGWKNGAFYDGVTVTRSKKIPQSNRNIIEIESFKQGLKNGLQNFVEELIVNHPDIVSSNDFMKIKNAIERI